MSYTTNTDTNTSSISDVMSLLDQTGIGYEVVYSGSDRSCPFDLAPAPPARAA
jgi:hypothetical protein